MLVNLLLTLTLLGATQPKVPNPLHYQVRPLPREDRTDLKVSLRFKPDTEGPVSLGGRLSGC